MGNKDPFPGLYRDVMTLSIILSVCMNDIVRQWD